MPGRGHSTPVGKQEGWTLTWRKEEVVPGLDQMQHQALGNRKVGLNLGDPKNLFPAQLYARSKGRWRCKLFNQETDLIKSIIKVY